MSWKLNFPRSEIPNRPPRVLSPSLRSWPTNHGCKVTFEYDLHKNRDEQTMHNKEFMQCQECGALTYKPLCEYCALAQVSG